VAAVVVAVAVAVVVLVMGNTPTVCSGPYSMWRRQDNYSERGRRAATEQYVIVR